MTDRDALVREIRNVVEFGTIQVNMPELTDLFLRTKAAARAEGYLMGLAVAMAEAARTHPDIAERIKALEELEPPA
jgi:Zn-dependent protease with chaperone function